MLGLLYHMCQAASDIAIPILAVKALSKKEPHLNKTLVSLLFVFLSVLYSFYSLNYIYIVIPIYISLIVKEKIKTNEGDDFLFPICSFVLLNCFLVPILNVLYFFLFNGYMDVNYSSFGLISNQNTEFFIKMTLLLILFSIRNSKLDTNIEFVSKYVKYSNLFMLICYLVFVIFMAISLTYSNNEELFILLSLLSSLIISLAFIFNDLYEKLYSNMKEKQDLQLENEKSKLQLAGLLETQKFVDEMKKFRHDIKNNFMIIDQLIQYKEYQAASNYLRKYIDSFEESHKNIHIDNLIVSAIVNDNVRRYPSLGFDVRCFIPAKLAINDVDLARILGNLLNNACEYVTRENIYCEILVKISAISETDLFIEVINPCKETEITADTLKTKKADAMNHGYGIINVKNTVLKYDGMFNNEIMNGNFISQILIPGGVKNDDQN